MLGYPARDSAPGYKGQIDVLCDWLIEQQKNRGDTPKFIVSASVFVPNDISTVDDDKRWKDDGWAAFPTTRKQLLQTIVDNKIQNVIFLSGDIHCSNVANIIFEEDGKALPLRAFSIVSSAFYWPWSFADGSPLGYVHDSKKLVTYTNKDRQQVSKDDGFKVNERVVMHYTAKNFQQDDNFTQVDIEPGRIIARTFDWKGKALDRSELKLG
jgi:alkaline phosphatase D